MFDGNQRFVLEVPLGAAPLYLPAVVDEAAADESMPEQPAVPVRPRRWPWLLLSALLLGATISALLFGAR